MDEDNEFMLEPGYMLTQDDERALRGDLISFDDIKNYIGALVIFSYCEHKTKIRKYQLVRIACFADETKEIFKHDKSGVYAVALPEVSRFDLLKKGYSLCALTGFVGFSTVKDKAKDPMSIYRTFGNDGVSECYCIGSRFPEITKALEGEYAFYAIKDLLAVD